MKDVTSFERSLLGVGKVAAKLQETIASAKREAVVHEGYVKGVSFSATMAEQRSAFIDGMLDREEITESQYKALKAQFKEHSTRLRKHQGEHFENTKLQKGRIMGLEFALKIAMNIGNDEHAALEAKKLSPDVNEKVHGAAEMREHLKEAREGSQAAAAEAAGVTAAQIDALLEENGAKELREMLKGLGLPVSGPKAELARRVLTAQAVAPDKRNGQAEPPPNGV